MIRYLNIVKYSYLQYTRSYSFLITTIFSLLVSFHFIPYPDANYATVRFGEYVGDYNSNWIGFVSSIFSSVTLSLFGFFLIEGSIKKDIDTRIGQIIGTTKITNLEIILTKIFTNFLILFTILLTTFLTSIILFLLYGNTEIEITAFIIPYLIIAVPSLFFISSFAIILEVLFPTKRLLRYTIFLSLFIFTFFSSFSLKKDRGFYDLFGGDYPAKVIGKYVEKKHPNENIRLSIGVIYDKNKSLKKFETQKITYPSKYITNRILWIALALSLGIISSYFFNRFNIRSKSIKIFPSIIQNKKSGASFQLENINVSTKYSHSIKPLIYSEIIMLLRKRSRFFWGIVFIGSVLMFFSSTFFAHSFILPILWFLQVINWSDLTTKDHSNRTHYFVLSSYRPTKRVFFSRVIVAFLMVFFTSIPILIKLAMDKNLTAFISVILGGMFIVLLSVFLGLLSKTKKIFEVVFFFILYGNLNSVPFTDYFGALHNSTFYIMILGGGTLLLLILSGFLHIKQKPL